MSYYELATLDTVIFGAGKAASAIEEWVSTGQGRLCGAWATDIGALNRVYVLRAFEDHSTMLEERERALRSNNPFGCLEHLTGLSMDSYRALDFLDGVPSGELGPVYEIRTYHLKLNALAPIIDIWRDAIPVREAYSKMALAMYALDGQPRFTQFWPYKSLDERSKARAQSVADGNWPPKNGPDWLRTQMTSDIAIPLAFSPLR